jgi:branched-subunit amino acid transport protein
VAYVTVRHLVEINLRWEVVSLYLLASIYTVIYMLVTREIIGVNYEGFLIVDWLIL